MINPGHRVHSTRLHDHDPRFKAPYIENRRGRNHHQNGQNSRKTKRKQRDQNGRHHAVQTYDDETYGETDETYGETYDDDMKDVEIVLEEETREDSKKRRRENRRKDKSRQRRKNKKNMLFGNPEEITIPMTDFYMADSPSYPLNNYPVCLSWRSNGGTSRMITEFT